MEGGQHKVLIPSEDKFDHSDPAAQHTTQSFSIYKDAEKRRTSVYREHCSGTYRIIPDPFQAHPVNMLLPQMDLAKLTLVRQPFDHPDFFYSS